MSKGISFLILTRKTDLGFVGKLEPNPEPKDFIFIQTTWLVKSVEGPRVFRSRGFQSRRFRDKGFEVVVSTSIPIGLSLEDKPVSSSLDLTTDLGPSSADIAHNTQC